MMVVMVAVLDITLMLKNAWMLIVVPHVWSLRLQTTATLCLCMCLRMQWKTSETSDVKLICKPSIVIEGPMMFWSHQFIQDLSLIDVF
jgi:hypothetical protein